MSISFMTLAWKTNIPSGRKLVLLALCDNANHQGECYPSVEVIAHKCSMGQRTVQQHIGALEAAGVLVRHFRRGRSTLYKIDLHHLGSPPGSAAVHHSHPAPAISASSPPQVSDFTSATSAPITINEPSKDPLPKRQVVRGTRLLATWTLPEPWAEWALQQHPAWTAEYVCLVAEKFRVHWMALAGQRGVRADWLATWRNWCRNEQSLVNGRVGRSDAMTMRKGAEMGLAPLPGESAVAFRRRVQHAPESTRRPMPVHPEFIPTSSPHEPVNKGAMSSQHRAAALDAARKLKGRRFAQKNPTPAPRGAAPSHRAD
jgi:DNA-binding transcriptional ArsR family regulator